MNYPETAWERAQRWLRESPTVKLFVIGFIILVLLIPLTFVRSLVSERQQRQHEAEAEISRTWGEEQFVTGPFITVPFLEAQSVNNSQTVLISYAHFLPEQLDIQSDLRTEIRSRGIFDVVVYTTDITLSGHFQRPAMDGFRASQVRWEDAVLHLGMNDLHSLLELPDVKFNEQPLAMEPGVDIAEIVSSGMTAPIRISDTGTSYSFTIHLKVRGSREIRFVPLGKETSARITGNWPSPSYQGSYLPDDRSTSDSSFQASWKLLYMNRTYPQQFKGQRSDIHDSAFGVNLLVPVNDYQKNERSAKYAVLIIALTFMVFFFVQVLNKVRIHGIQFMLVGLALCLFYALLVSFTEHLGFNPAYLLAAALTIGLISLYVKAIFKNSKLTIINLAMLTCVYGFVFVIIQLEEYSLLVGSIGLFLVLSAAMYLSRNITWNEQLSRTGEE